MAFCILLYLLCAALRLVDKVNIFGVDIGGYDADFADFFAEHGIAADMPGLDVELFEAAEQLRFAGAGEAAFVYAFLHAKAEVVQDVVDFAALFIVGNVVNDKIEGGLAGIGGRGFFNIWDLVGLVLGRGVVGFAFGFVCGIGGGLAALGQIVDDDAAVPGIGGVKGGVVFIAVPVKPDQGLAFGGPVLQGAYLDEEDVFETGVVDWGGKGGLKLVAEKMDGGVGELPAFVFVQVKIGGLELFAVDQAQNGFVDVNAKEFHDVVGEGLEALFAFVQKT